MEATTHRLANEHGTVTALHGSPLCCALQTAWFIGAAVGLQPGSVADLREIHYGRGYPLDNRALTCIHVEESGAQPVVLNDRTQLPAQ